MSNIDKTVRKLKRDIAYRERKLVTKAKKTGLYENFGQKEYRQLQDKYMKNFYDDERIRSLLLSFGRWITLYIPY